MQFPWLVVCKILNENYLRNTLTHFGVDKVVSASNDFLSTFSLTFKNASLLPKNILNATYEDQGNLLSHTYNHWWSSSANMWNKTNKEPEVINVFEWSSSELKCAKFLSNNNAIVTYVQSSLMYCIWYAILFLFVIVIGPSGVQFRE